MTLFLELSHASVDQFPLVPSCFKWFLKPRVVGNQNRYSGNRIVFV